MLNSYILHLAYNEDRYLQSRYSSISSTCYTCVGSSNWLIFPVLFSTMVDRVLPLCTYLNRYFFSYLHCTFRHSCKTCILLIDLYCEARPCVVKCSIILPYNYYVVGSHIVVESILAFSCILGYLHWIMFWIPPLFHPCTTLVFITTWPIDHESHHCVICIKVCIFASSSNNIT